MIQTPKDLRNRKRSLNELPLISYISDFTNKFTNNSIVNKQYVDDEVGGIEGGSPYVVVNSTGTVPVATGNNSIAIGFNSKAIANESISIGINAASTTGTHQVGCISIGNSVNTGSGAIGSQSVTIGNNLNTNSNWSVNIGYNGNVTSSAGVMIGLSNGISGSDSIVIGRSTSSTVTGGMHFGANSSSFANSTAKSFQVSWDNVKTLNFQKENILTGDQTGFEYNLIVNKASGNYTAFKVNVAETAVPGADNNLLDYQVNSTSVFNVKNKGVLNLFNTTSTTNTTEQIAVFERKTTGTAANNIGGRISIGVQNNVGVQKYLHMDHILQDSISTTEDSAFKIYGLENGSETIFLDIYTGANFIIGPSHTITGNLNYTIGRFNTAIGNSITIGEYLTSGDRAISLLGRGASDYSIGIGLGAVGIGGNSIAIGRDSKTYDINCISIGYNTGFNNTGGSGQEVISIGYEANSEEGIAVATNGIAIGSFAGTVALAGIAIGAYSKTTAQGAIIMGYHTSHQVNSLTDSFMLSWDGTKQFHVGGLIGCRIPTDAAPSTNMTSAEAGSIAYNTTSNKLQVYNGSTWETVTSS